MKTTPTTSGRILLFSTSSVSPIPDWLLSLTLRLARPLEPGFVLTIEPGIYFIPELMDYWKAENRFTEFINYEKLESYREFTGLRNEEDYLITETGARRLGKKKPMTTDEVEALR